MFGPFTPLHGARPARAGAAALAVGLAVLAPGGADAQTPAACDSRDRAQRPALVLRALPARIAPDRDIPFLIVRASRGSTTAVYRGGASIATEHPHEQNFLTEYYLQPDDERELGSGTLYWIRMRAGEAPATVRLSYVQHTATGQCRVTISRRVQTVAPRRPQLRLRTVTTARGRELRLSVGARGGCARARNGRTAVRLSGAGRSATIRLADLCDAWDRRRVRLPGLDVVARDARIGPWPELRLRARGPARRYRLRVTFRDRVLLHRTVRIAR